MPVTEVFSSMEPSDILVGNRTSRGVRLLREYLEYAKTGKVLERVLQGGSPENDFEAAVGKAISDLGYETAYQIGVVGFFIDIGVIHPDRPGEYLIGIECDGAAYHSSRFARDRDRLRQQILEDKGWRIHRIWSTNWFHARAQEIDRLKWALEKHLDVDRRQTATLVKPREEIPIVNVPSVFEESGPTRARDEDTLREALDRYYETNIKPASPNRARSILSNEIVARIVRLKPETKREWQHYLPLELRQRIEASQGKFLEDILDIVVEHA